MLATVTQPGEPVTPGALAPAVELKAISKRFGAVQALDAAALRLTGGTIHAVLGENGAGKSTLMRILAGFERPDSGTVTVAGRPVAFGYPGAALRAGIALVHQHFMLVPELSIAENVVLGAEPARWGGFFDARAAGRVVAHWAQQYGMALPPVGTPVKELSVAAQQQVEILKILYRRAQVVLFDEPTAVLAPPQVQQLFTVLRRLRAEGRAVVLITHRLVEVLQVADTVTVLRHGKTVLAGAAAGAVSEADIVRYMMGGPAAGAGRGVVAPALEPEPEECARRREVRPAVVLRLEGVQTAPRPEACALKDVSLAVHRGEIVGLAGVAGNGQAAIMALLRGAMAPTAGRVEVAGEVFFPGQSGRRRARAAARVRAVGLGSIPEDRHRDGLLLPWSIADNVILGRQREASLGSGWWRRHAPARRLAQQLLKGLALEPLEVTRPVQQLSGGQQQKVLVARELAKQPRVLLAAEPTRGVDMAAAQLVHAGLRAARDAGAAVVLVSADITELLQLSDRIGVLYGGRLVALEPRAAMTAARLGTLMTGG